MPEYTADDAATRSFAGDRTDGPAEDPAGTAEEAFYLLVVERASSRLVPLPSAGFRFIGRSPDADIRVEDPSASRRHAKVQVQGGTVRLIDLGSRNGLRVNGAVLEGARDIAPGDVVTIGDVALILRGRSRQRARRALLGAEELTARLGEEVERALEYARPLSVAVAAPGPAPHRAAEADRAPDRSAPSFERAALAAALDHHLRNIDMAGQMPDGTVVAVFPERTAAEARAATSLLVEHLAAASPGCRAGVASCPDEGCDAETLIGAARDACRAARAAGVAGEAEHVRTTILGDRVVVLADPAMIRLFSLIERLAAAHLPVLVCGETGVGKEHAAFAVHHGSARRAGPFLSVNCAAIPDTLVESELFGHDRGAFSGAHAAKPGLFERASGGTLFLDEVGELTLSAQAKLLRVLEGGRFTRLGETREREVDVRIVAATNRDLQAEVKARRFREDLFYRLSSAVVLLPPLRERPADIPVLARRFLAAARARAQKPPLTFAPAAMLALAHHAWPGNVRELKNAMEFVAASVPDGVVERSNLPAAIAGAEGSEPAAPTSAQPDRPSGADLRPPAGELRPLAEEIEALERRRIREALAAASGVKTRAARLIGVPERTFRLKLRQYGIDRGGSDEG
ncbi:sigma 54-interacting transcriptional regulator [Sorangium sp. So ce291]|uniref:sigma 54-interacting transcriptional regulator n=1 Tax=Sorangium sp. So ce291 TaxID=3133294 RepID=UPI003F60C6E0